jgi:UDP-glucose 4-epimerase
LFIENFRQAYRLNFTVLRYGSLYGTRANAFNFIHNIVRQALIEKRIQRKGDGNEIREYINVVDAARSSVDILTEEFINSYVIITGMQTMKVRDLLAMIKEILGNEITIEYLNEPLEDHYEITPYAFRPRVAKKYIPPYYHDLGEGILECIHDVYHELLTGRKIMPYEIVIPRSREPKR